MNPYSNLADGTAFEDFDQTPEQEESQYVDGKDEFQYEVEAE